MIIELVGLAGSGKSTLTKELSLRIDNSRIEIPPTFRKVQNLPFFIRNTFEILPFLPWIYFRRSGRYSSRYHFFVTLLLNGWHKTLDQDENHDGSLIILDQGPVYMIAFETLFCPSLSKSSISKRFWARVFHNWAKTLDMVVWLDAPLPTLVERIRKRETRHGIKELFDADAYQYLSSYHHTYDSVISKLQMCSKSLNVVHMDTEKNTVHETLETITDKIYQ